METQFRNLDVLIHGQPMPPEFRDTKALVLCNDCSGKCTVPYHWLGLKCSICRSYNTVELQILGGDTAAVQAAATREPTSASTQAAATTAQARDVPTRPATQVEVSPIPVSTSEGVTIATRRRHSSHGTELMHHMSDRFARSLSTYIGTESHMSHLGHESDSEDEMLGFWSHTHGGGDLHGDDELDSGDDSAMSDIDEEEDDDEEEEEDENDLFLIGHR